MKLPASKKNSKSVNVLFSSIGRRVSLLKAFRAAAKKLKINASFYATDITELSPAIQLCDKKFLVKPIPHPDYIKDIIKIVKTHNIDLIVPTIDLDLKLLAQNKPEFEKLSCRVLVSNPDVIDICQDKRKTFKFLTKNGFDAPITTSPKSALSKKNFQFPCLLKPYDGYASKENVIVKNPSELKLFAKRVTNPICQQIVKGSEYTCDVYVDFDMKVRSVVPRKRIEIRAGEVSKGQIVKNPAIMEKAKQVVEKLQAGPGVITCQLFLTPENEFPVIEINPRFGGGAPLSIKAGADFPKWVLAELIGKKPIIKFDNFKDNLVMLRYDAEVWLQK